MVDPDAIAAHRRFDDIEAEFHASLEASLDPRGPDSLFDVVASFGLPKGAFVVDVGCGRGNHAIELATRFDLNVLGIDPVDRHRHADRTADALKAGHVRFCEGTAESIPVDTSSVDLIFCRESLMYSDLNVAMSEFRRTLRTGGRGLVYQVLTGPRMTDAEAAELWAFLTASSLRPDDIDDAITRAGLLINRQIDYGSEWGERAQEREGTAGQRLLYAARLLREPQRYINQFGQTNYNIMLGDCLWHAHRMTGKLAGYACTFTKP
jgi:SAM-dependent methyltransferase